MPAPGWIQYDFSTFIYAPPLGHSRKPDGSYDMIEALSEDPRLELFARRQRFGWDAWGDEVGITIPHMEVRSD